MNYETIGIRTSDVEVMKFKEMMVWNNKEHCTAEQILLLKQELTALEARRECS